MAGIYIHVPFCHSKCYYCDFYSIGSRGGKEGADRALRFVDCIKAEYDRRRAELAGAGVSTVYIGGGTPSSLPAAALEALLSFADTLIGTRHYEFTLEVNPEDVTPEFCSLICSHRVNRVSMGIQTFNDTILKAIGRRHTAAGAISAIDRLRQSGISNISGDLIFGLPGDTLKGWTDTLEQFMQLGLPHLSAYLLSYEPGTRLSVMRDRGKVVETTDDTIYLMYDKLLQMTRQAGYRHYEISNYAKESMHSRHNSSYWDSTPYLGLGPGAHSFDGLTRRLNPPSLKDYLAAGGVDFFETEPLAPTDRVNDIIITALRTATGLDTGPRSPLAQNVVKSVLEAAGPHLDIHNLELTAQGRLVIPEDRWLISDSILVDLIQS